MLTLKISRNNTAELLGPFKTERDLVMERSSLIKTYNYDRKHGFNRENHGNMIVYKHTVYTSIVFETMRG